MMLEINLGRFAQSFLCFYFIEIFHFHFTLCYATLFLARFNYLLSLQKVTYDLQTKILDKYWSGLYAKSYFHIFLFVRVARNGIFKWFPDFIFPDLLTSAKAKAKIWKRESTLGRHNKSQRILCHNNCLIPTFLYNLSRDAISINSLPRKVKP